MSEENRFAAELARWGPQAQTPATSLAEAESYCRTLAKTHYENFPVVSWLLPRKLQQHFLNIYAFCRWSDDLADEVPNATQSLQLLDWWQGELTDCYAGNVRHPVFIALRKTIAECGIPREPFEDLISAFVQDQSVREYDTFAQLHDYCRRSADPVGRLLLHVSGEYHDENVQWSDRICTGLQLTNFWQDVARDLDIGRVYLPQEDCRRFGYSRDDLQSRVTNDAFVELMRFEVDRAREFLVSGLPLVDRLPGRLQMDIDLFARGGLRILRRIEAVGYGVWTTRPVLKKRHVAGLFLGSATRCVFRRLIPRRYYGREFPGSTRIV
ncbi:MAG: squalene synthase HpnC [Planctomycetes bacterium]|nr:squalene synthase HpnC [Planctomycetota bacterium]